MQGPGRAKMADVARRAGVSTATVSRALRGMPGVSDEQRRRIRAIADEIHYVVSPEASRLSLGHTGRVAVLVPTIDRWYFATVLAGLEAELRRAAMDVLIYHVGGVDDQRRFFDELPARRNADAVVVIALPLTPGETERLGLLGVPVVVAGGHIDGRPGVRIDDEMAAAHAVRHLTDLGHRRIALLRSRDFSGRTWPVDLARTRGYRRALADVGATWQSAYQRTVAHSASNARAATEELLALPEPPTAVFAASDELALGALRALETAGLRVPEDVSVVGIDDHPLAGLHDLTTVRQPVGRIGRLAALSVLDLLAPGAPRPPVEDQVLETELVVRRSTAAPAATVAHGGPAGARHRTTSGRTPPAGRRV